MPKPKPTVYQQQAIDFKSGNCLVSAGAGSGKTDVLTKRIYHLVKNNVCRLDQMLVLTFTNKAAFEMKQRARALIANDPDTRHLLPEVEQAAITTFDGFALSLVKTYHYDLGIDSDVNIVDDAMMSVQRYRLLDKILERHYEAVKQGQDKDFEALVKGFCVKDDSRIIKSILNAYALAALKEDKRSFLSQYMEEHFTSEYFDAMMVDYVSCIKNLFERLVEGFQSYNDGNLANHDTNFITGYFLSCKTYDDFKAAFDANEKFITKPKRKKDDPEEDPSDKKLRETLKKNYWFAAKDCCRFKDEAEAIESFACLKPYIATICKLAIELIDEEEIFMKEHACYRFEDIAMLARRLARTPSIQEKLRKTYTFIMVDEYQDTSDLQEDLISMISTGNAFFVGDIKQSIYRFRNANPALFTSKVLAYQDKEKGTLIQLPDNFRSREQIIDDINAIFSDIMSQKVGGASYKNGHALRFGNHSYDATATLEDYGVKAYLYDIDIESAREEQEARLIASDIVSKINGGFKVKGDDGGRNVGFGDFAILTSSKTIYDTYARVFNEFGIPLAVSSEIELKEENIYFIVRNLFDFLLGLMKRRDDIHMRHLFASISRSFIVGMKDQEIASRLIGNTYLQTNWVCELADYAKIIYGDTIYEIYANLFRIFDIPSKLTLAKNVISNYERIETLYEAAKTGTEFGWGLEDFVSYFEDLSRYEIKLGQEIPPSDCDAVRLMTIHASKGLQFPIVYLPQLYKKFKVQIPGADPKVTYDLNYGLLLPTIKPDQRADNIATYLHETHDNEENVSERMRLFYVALTRAMEECILILSKKQLKDDGTEDEGTVIDSIASAKSFKDFVYFVKNGIKFQSYDPLDEDLKPLDNSPTPRKLEFREINCVGTLIPPTIRPSKEIRGKVDEGALAFGTRLHRLLELSDLVEKDCSWIEDARERLLIEKVLHLPIFDNLIDAKTYREYEFVDENGQKGIIDLLIVFPNRAVIVDYKTNNIDDDAYGKQLDTYKRYVESAFKKQASGYLLSILKAEMRQVF